MLFYVVFNTEIRDPAFVVSARTIFQCQGLEGLSSVRITPLAWSAEPSWWTSNQAWRTSHIIIYNHSKSRYIPMRQRRAFVGAWTPG